MSVKYFDSPEGEAVALSKVREFLGCEPPTPCGYKITVALYVKDESGGNYVNSKGEKTAIVIPEATLSQDTYTNPVGMVVAVGPLAYTGDKFKDSGPFCKLGDWVVIPRHGGIQVFYKTKAVHNLYDDMVEMVIEQPTDVTRYK